MQEDSRIEDIMKHLDSEVSRGSMRMSVEVNEKQEEAEKVSHKCCKIYGKEANRIVNELDMYSDLYLHEKM